MGKKGGWFSAVRKALIPSYDSKEKKEKPQKTASKKSWFGKQKNIESETPHEESVFATPALRSPFPEPEEEVTIAEPENSPKKPAEPEIQPNKPTEPKIEPNKPTNPVIEEKKPPKPEFEPPPKPPKPVNEPVKPSFAYSRAAVAAAAFRRLLGKSKEDIAAIKIQTAFRRFSARRKLRSLKGYIRLKVLIQSQSVKRQAITTLRCMQTLARVQSQVRARRIRMSEENQALQRQLMQKRERELDNMRFSMGGEWNNSRRTKEEVEASLQKKVEATALRERALAYAQTQQQMWKNQKNGNPTFMDPNNPHWGWSWLDRWMAARPWESQSPNDNEPPPPVKTITRSSSVGDMSNSVSSPRSPSVSGRRLAASSPKKGNDSVLSPRNRRHSIANTSLREESSVSSPRASSPRVSSPRVSSPRSTKTKSVIPAPVQSPSRSPSPCPSPLGSAKKKPAVNRRLSMSGAPPGRRVSGSSRVGPGSR
ncbi:protein IQ-DOMAIN 2 [Lactuca sativa]|uniref:DUF4005 domain-containing protein n=1 Tax=Lactuca sativa TaxID=4236 RepID=A0A9R1UMI6_LACSA|nr:protein IQ-DOMAIN 2 [Lactuca sativa]KAJ0189521.1 hypothetical protein LSAT_V11C800396650 [Lactuca sativa]